ncbi:MAG: hypothetical protein M0T70_07055 [Geobacteraceae bacterium]|nr:hypothetical protein [Geobacteraceae bacterium]
MKHPRKNIILLYAALSVIMATPAFAEESRSPIPFGGYMKNGRCGYYGARVAVKTVAEARRIIEDFLEGHDLQIGAMDERPRFFRAELVDKNGTVRDVVVVNKVNGRVRSTY